jgi:soluble lytic murein transglycosylase-like protein
MSVSVVPAIFLALVFVLTKVDNGVALNQELSAKNKLEQLSEHVLNSKESVKKTFKTSQKLSDIQLEKDMKAIYSFITEKFNKITETDAKEITDNLINYGKKYDLDPKIAAAVIARESGFQKKAVSNTGAKGLGQIKDFNFKNLKISDPYNINQNINGTVKYLKEMVDNWNKEPNTNITSTKQPETEHEKVKLALASYYKGFTGVKKTGVDKKTEEYIDDILDYYNEIAKD